MSIKLKDIANELGISISTVSRALCEETANKVKPSTRAQIEYTIKKLGYLQNKNTEIAPMNDSRSVGIILTSTSKSFSHEFFAEMLNPLLSELYKADYSINYVLSQISLPNEKFLSIIQETYVSGAIVMGKLDEELLLFLKKNIPHLVYAGVNYIGHDTDEVICNGFEAIKTLYDHFKSIGYKSIGYIGSTNIEVSTKNDYQRYSSYLQCKEKYQDKICLDHVHHSTDTMETGYNAMVEIIKTKNLPEAILCTSDSGAIGAIQAAHEHGIKIPEDIAIAGVDNLTLSNYLIPKLTTVEVPKEELVRLAVNMLADRMKNNREKNIRLDIPHELIIRESCGYNLKMKK